MHHHHGQRPANDRYCVDSLHDRRTANRFPFFSNATGAIACRGLFIDLTHEDMNSRLHVVGRIYRIGSLVWKPNEKVQLYSLNHTVSCCRSYFVLLCFEQKEYNHSFRRPWGCFVLPIKDALLDQLLSKVKLYVIRPCT